MEGFAESFAAYIYPRLAQADVNRFEYRAPGLYYSDYLTTFRGILMNALVNVYTHQ